RASAASTFAAVSAAEGLGLSAWAPGGAGRKARMASGHTGRQRRATPIVETSEGACSPKGEVDRAGQTGGKRMRNRAATKKSEVAAVSRDAEALRSGARHLDESGR